MTQVLEYASPPPARRRTPPLVRLARFAAVAVPLLQLLCIGIDLEMRRHLIREHEREWHASELLRRAYERDRRTVGYPRIAAPAPAPAPPTLRCAVLLWVAVARAPFALLAVVFAGAIARHGWPSSAPRRMHQLAIGIGSLAALLLLTTAIGYGWDIARDRPVATALALLSIAMGFGLVGPVLAARE